MAQMARDYHNSVQNKDLSDEYARTMATEITLEQCKVHLSETQFNDMESDKDLETEDIGEALKLSNGGKAPGLDGLPYEFYKILDILFQQSKGSDRQLFDVLGFLKKTIY
ncbi:hypothetical protein B0H14DRAFT_2373583 [Mycena olivaceomarginata]|nr:hypothetical protein B0H14DRAFT_2373583 [Mycena olivaceomarginata]